MEGPAVMINPDGRVEGHGFPGPLLGVNTPLEGPIWQVHKPSPSFKLVLLHAKDAVAEDLLSGTEGPACDGFKVLKPVDVVTDGFIPVFNGPVFADFNV